MHRNRSVDLHDFSMIPRADIPRSGFRLQKALKTAFDSGYLVPVLCEEMLPGDSISMQATFFARLATPIFPIMDNLYLDCFFFFCPNRLVWTNFVRMMGEQDNPDDSIDFVVPVIESPAGGYAIGSVHDYFGLPTVGQVDPAETTTNSSLPLRMYNRIYNEWFRDQNLQDSVPMHTGDATDPDTDYVLLRRGKRHDYFTGCLPWPQKGGDTLVPLILTGDAPVLPNLTPPNVGNVPLFRTASVATPAAIVPASGAIAANLQTSVASSAEAWQWTTQTGLRADLSAAAANTINQLRTSFQIQRLLERDARGGTRYTESIRSHFGVISPDARLQRPEYLGGGSTLIGVRPVAQTSETSAETPQGNLAAFSDGVLKSGFSASFTEHGYLIGLVNVRADLTYQQGLRRHWNRATRFEFYYPVFAALGEQAVETQEIYVDGTDGDQVVFGYQERWAEYRNWPSEITGLMRSTAAGTIDAWHLAQRFTEAPNLSPAFITENPPLSRVLAVGAGANGQQLIMDALFDARMARAMPMYSVPGMMDHF